MRTWLAVMLLGTSACHGSLQASKRHGGVADSGAKVSQDACVDPDLAKLAASETIMLCDGTLAVGLLTLQDCTSSGQTGCLANEAFPAASAAGVAKSRPPCAKDGEVGCVTGSDFKAAKVTTVSPADIRQGVTVAGVTGTLTPTDALPDCAANLSVDCVATSAYRAADLTNLTPDNIRNGVNVAGTVGAFPSAGHPLTGASGAADLDSAAFGAMLKSATPFEWWDSSGARHAGTGDADLAAAKIKDGVDVFGTIGSYGPPCALDGESGCLTGARYKAADTDASAISDRDVRAGKTFGGITGKMKYCKNIARVTPVQLFDNVAAPAVAGLDVFDTVDDLQNFAPALAPDAPFGADFACTAADWDDVTADGACDSPADACAFKDLNTGMTWSEVQPTTEDWEGAITLCDGLTFAGRSDWRLPTQKELYQVFVNGLSTAISADFGDLDGDFVSSTSSTLPTTEYVTLNLLFGDSSTPAKSTANAVICVAP
jgi:hypothetical protein